MEIGLIELGAPANGAAADAPIRKRGRPVNFDNVKDTDGGNRIDYIAGRLKRYHPELAEEVIAGRLSAHAAAVQAGFRKATWTAPADPGALAVAIAKRYPGWEMRKA